MFWLQVWRERVIFLLVFSAIWAALSFAVAQLTYRQIAYSIDHEFVYIRNGFLKLNFFVIPMARIQSAALFQTYFQRRKGLATLHLDIAGSARVSAEIPNISIQDAWLLLNKVTKTRALMVDEAMCTNGLDQT